MLNFIVRIARVDEYGFCGRDNHPESRDVGRYVRVVGLETVEHDAGTVDRYPNLARVSRQADSDGCYTVFYGFILGGPVRSVTPSSTALAPNP